MKKSAKADFVLCHADRDMMKLRQEEHVVLPAAVLIEVLVAAALCMIGSLGLAGDLKPIYATANQEGVDMDVFRPDFMAFNHRGYALPLAVDSISGSSGSSSLKKNKDQ
ncbi:hypothetical protein CVIRNUC_009709 [Coccomyxa viridis]|uniref:CASP-like protein n=1 Tax=Coccomyxa viridis TaxID=1274662 RepID=A0AAV1IGN9_9CHLO|nr:hypothetical protein CVIRNUC_009709 [Coccomyxa viridis]